MAYEKQNWECGETITADKLNHMEDGIENAGGSSEPLVVNMVDTDPALNSAKSETHASRSIDTPHFWLDKPWQDIWDAYPNITIRSESEEGSGIFKGGVVVAETTQSNTTRYVVSVITAGTLYFYADSTNDYPETSDR